MSPKLVDRRLRKNQISLAALDEFAQKGFAIASMSSIAKAAGLGKGTLYDYFSSKEELISHALHLWVEKVETQVAGAQSDEPDPCARIRSYMFGVTDILKNDPRTMGLMLAVFQLAIAGEKPVMLKDIFRQTRMTLREMILQGVEQGRFTPDAGKNAQLIANNIIAFLDGILMHALVLPGETHVPAQIENYLATLFSAIEPS